MSLNPLGLVKEVVESVGMAISYAYEDLVFMEHNAYLLQFTEGGKRLLIHMNKETNDESIREDVARLKAAAAEHGLDFRDGSFYTLAQEDGDNIRLEFL